MQPLNSYILVKRIPDDVKQGSIYISNADSLGIKVHRGEVLAVNRDCKDLVIGDKIIYNKYAEHPTGMDDKDIILVRTEDIEAVLV